MHTALRLPEKLAGMMALSGYLPLVDTAEAERNAANNATPIFMAHGQYDPVVSLARAEASLTELKRLGYDVRWHTYPMPHSVCAEEVRDISAFLNAVLG
ncbi:Carboxylesterase 2 [compost metagenome]